MLIKRRLSKLSFRNPTSTLACSSHGSNLATFTEKQTLSYSATHSQRCRSRFLVWEFSVVVAFREFHGKWRKHLAFANTHCDARCSVRLSALWKEKLLLYKPLSLWFASRSSSKNQSTEMAYKSTPCEKAQPCPSVAFHSFNATDDNWY